MSNPLTSKLELFARLSDDDAIVIDCLARERVRSFRPREDIVREGERLRGITLFLSGWACRYKQLADGRRQIVAWLLPGDVCGIDADLLGRMDHSIAALGPVTIAEVSRDRFEEVARSRPRIVEALWWGSLVDLAIQREWAVNLGQRDAAERIAHLFCETFVRLRSVGQTEGASFRFPATQVELADTTGMSSVHVNRTVQELRGLGLVIWSQRRLTLPDFDALARLALFNPSYLHLDRVGRHRDANDRASAGAGYRLN